MNSEEDEGWSGVCVTRASLLRSELNDFPSHLSGLAPVSVKGKFRGRVKYGELTRKNLSPGLIWDDGDCCTKAGSL